jgi:hypothetical protein
MHSQEGDTMVTRPAPGRWAVGWSSVTKLSEAVMWYSLPLGTDRSGSGAISLPEKGFVARKS